MDPSSPQPSRLLALPAEIRDQIYTEVLRERLRGDELHQTYGFHLSCLRTCRQVHSEATRRFHIDHTFVSFETPWEGAPRWAQEWGRIPTVATGHAATQWPKTRLHAAIHAPFLGTLDATRFIILLQDLNAFTEHWFYQELKSRETSEGGLNSHLYLTLTLENIDLPSESLSSSKQRQLLEPFGKLKNLARVDVQGANTDVAEDLKKVMAVPLESPTDCLELAIKYKDEGNQALRAGKPQAALELYAKSFKAIHIVVKGRQRDVHADHYFHVTLSRRLENDESGQNVYYRMRVRLVANVMMAYIKMENWEEAKFWGMRSINLMREMAGSLADVPNDNMPGSTEWGKVYYRTGVAAEKLDDMPLAREMYRIAHGWLPNDNAVTEAVGRTALRLG